MFSALILLILSCFTIGIMIKLFKVKEKQRELAENSNGKPPVKKQSAGELRLHKGKVTSNQIMILLLQNSSFFFLFFLQI